VWQCSEFLFPPSKNNEIFSEEGGNWDDKKERPRQKGPAILFYLSASISDC
jgi:hypothetical protein